VSVTGRRKTRRRSVAMKSDDPWAGLVRPTVEETITAKRVDASNPWDFFWGVDLEGRCMLVLQHSTTPEPDAHLPHLKGVEIARRHPEGKPAILTFRLLESAHRDIFETLCRDIVIRCQEAKSESEVVSAAIARTWRWHHLLRGGADGRLSPDEQKGLIGELLVLERLLLQTLSASDAIRAWHGPLGASKDFEIGTLCIEAKARNGAAKPYVTINSEHQLDDSGLYALFLYVVDVTNVPSSTPGAVSVTDVARRLRRVLELAPAVMDQFDALVEAAGLRWDDDYSDSFWFEGPGRVYRVRHDFPRIGSSVPSGVSDVRYSLSLTHCEPFLVEEADLRDEIERFADAIRS
jgi:hypothetical protein